MVNKKGIFRIVEASVAVLIILAVVLIISSKTKFKDETDLSETLSPILDEISKDKEIREKVFNNEEQAKIEINNILRDKISNRNLNAAAVICKVKPLADDLPCSCLENYPEDAEGEIYSNERVISTTLNLPDYEPKKIKACLWRIER